jgi:hypothetical protein
VTKIALFRVPAKRKWEVRNHPFPLIAVVDNFLCQEEVLSWERTFSFLSFRKWIRGFHKRFLDSYV